MPTWNTLAVSQGSSGAALPLMILSYLHHRGVKANIIEGSRHAPRSAKWGAKEEAKEIYLAWYICVVTANAFLASSSLARS